MREGDLEIAVTVLRAGAVPGLARRVVGTRHETAVRDELAIAREASDVIDLEGDGAGVELADAGDPEDALDIGEAEHLGIELMFEPMDLGEQEVALLQMTRRLELVDQRQRLDREDVELLQQPVDTVPAAGAFGDEAQASAQQVSFPAKCRPDHVGGRNELRLTELGQCVRVNRIGLHLGGADGLETRGVCQLEVDSLGYQQVAEPVPAAGAFDDRAMGPGELGKVADQRRAVVAQAALAEALAAIIVSGDDGVALVLVDTGVEHGTIPSRVMGI